VSNILALEFFAAKVHRMWARVVYYQPSCVCQVFVC